MNTLENNWRHLSRILQEFYTKNRVEHRGVGHRIDSDLQYLEKAYFEVEAFWEKAFNEIQEVKLILFSEAPLYGSEKSYFYNPSSDHTAFFSYNDAEVIVGELTASSRLTDRGIPRKLQMLQELNKAGLLIVDLFPFSLNDGCQFDYKTMEDGTYENLFTSTREYHIDCKLRAILPKTTQSTQFAFRYKRVKNILEHQTLCAVDEIMGRSLCSIESIGGTNMPMDRSKLRNLWSISTTT